jgi:chromosome partitioning protein
MRRSIAFINQKGGVGKTTLVANAGACWGREGRRVLLIDLDPQAHLSLHFGVGGDGEHANIYRVLRGEVPFAESVLEIPAEKVSLVPAHIDLAAAEWELGQEVGREVILRDLLAGFLASRAFDLVLIDCPPSLGLLSLNALAAGSTPRSAGRSSCRRSSTRARTSAAR